MKPPPFTYHDPQTVPEVLDLLAEKDNARLLSGGQSLMPMLNMRYVLPDDVIDLNRVDGLSGIEAANGSLRIAGMTRQRDIEFSDAVSARCPISTPRRRSRRWRWRSTRRFMSRASVAGATSRWPISRPDT